MGHVRDRLGLFVTCVLACCLPLLILGAGVSTAAALAGFGTLAGGVVAAAGVTAVLRYRRHHRGDHAN